MRQFREQLRVAGTMLVGSVISASLLTGGYVLVFRLWWSTGTDVTANPTERTLGYWRLLAFSLFPVIAAIMGLFSGRSLGRRIWPVLLMIWPLFFAATLAYQNELGVALLFDVAYAAIAVLTAWTFHAYQPSRDEAARPQQGGEEGPLTSVRQSRFADNTRASPQGRLSAAVALLLLIRSLWDLLPRHEQPTRYGTPLQRRSIAKSTTADFVEERSPCRL